MVGGTTSMEAVRRMMKIGEVHAQSGVPIRNIREWADDGLIPEAAKPKKSSKRGRTDWQFDEGSVERVIAIATMLVDISFDREEVKEIFKKYDKRADLGALSERLSTVPFHEFLEMLRKGRVDISPTEHLDRFVESARGRKRN